MTEEIFSPIRWQNDRLELIDQRLLPHEEVWLHFDDAQTTAQAITDLVVRGAPAIGITAAYGLVLSAQVHSVQGDWREKVLADLECLGEARPTAVNLRWAMERMRPIVMAADGERLIDRLLSEARQIHEEDVAANLAMGRHGAGLLEDGVGVLTHCNAGTLATGGYGTALGVIRSGVAAGKIHTVFAGETRPWLQGARLTAWELLRDGIDVTLVLEGAVPSLFRSGSVDWFIVGSDRIVANGDVANKIGTYAGAIAARRHGAKVMVAAPSSTVDFSTPSGDLIPIESRSEAEVLEYAGKRVAAPGARAWNPVFDVTPAELVDAIVTEGGVALPPFDESLPRVCSGSMKQASRAL